MRKILLILGHPVADSFSNKVLEAYAVAAQSTGAEVKVIKLRELSFDLNFSQGYRGNQELEPDLVKAQQQILWADHLVLIYPNWWATFPALMKGFIDRTILPGFAFNYHKDRSGWTKMLRGRSARVIVTMDNHKWYYRWVLKRPGHNAMKKGILGFVGIRPVRFFTIGPLKTSTEKQRQQWLKKVECLGRKQK